MITGLGLICLVLFFILSVWIYAKFEGPPPIHVAQNTIYYSADGQKIGQADYHNQTRYWVKLNHISPYLQKATIDVEDKRFYQHHGFDFKRMAAAAFTDIKSFSKVQGASTITMQYARNLYLSNDKTWQRKFLEAFDTMRLEMNYSKNQILEGYLNTIYYGHGVYGAEAASEYYYGKHAKDLTLAEASMLAGIPKGPTYYSPTNNYKRAKSRQKLILSKMVEQKDITKQQAQAAYNEKLHFVTKHPGPAKVAPYFQDAVNYVLKNTLHMTSRELSFGGYHVYTTLNVTMQHEAEKWINKIIEPKSKIQAAMVAMDPQTGAVQALIGGRDYSQSSYDRAIQARRTPGSSFKPFLYYAALKNGFTPSTLLRSEPTTFTYNNGKSHYSPTNYGGYYEYGPISLAQALALSDNIYAVKTNLFIGPQKLVNAAHKMGITSKLSPIPSLALGSMPVSVLNMTRGYAAIANGGYRVTPYFITKIVDHTGKVVYNAQVSRKKVLDPNYAFVLSQMMTGLFDDNLDAYAKVTGSSVKSILTHTVAGKSGTTPSDSWMLGFTPHLVSGVWVGYDNGKPISTFPDEKYSKNIWANFMEAALKGQPKDSFKPPSGVVGAMVNPTTGLLASKDCPTSRWTYYIKGTQPTMYCQAKSLGFNKNNATQKKQPKAQQQHHGGGHGVGGLFHKLWHKIF